MSETEALRNRLAALRSPASATPDATSPCQLETAAGIDARIRRLKDIVANGQDRSVATEVLVRTATENASSLQPAAVTMPAQLTSRARRLLGQAQEHVAQLKTTAERLAKFSRPAGASTTSPSSQPTAFIRLCREATSLAIIALRTLQSLPADPAGQQSMSEGIDALLQVVALKSARLQALLAGHEGETARVDELAARLRNLADGKVESWEAFTKLADVIATEVGDGAPLHAYEAAPLVGDRYDGSTLEPARWLACHACNVAQIAARLLRHDSKLLERMPEALAAALLLDVGMLRVPPDAWLHAGALSIGQRRQIEKHVRAGTELAVKLAPMAVWLHQAVAAHQERMDGTGYPSGQRGQDIPPLAGWLAVADVYAALTEPRMHRAALEPRDALAETLLLAEQKFLDDSCAERLLQLSFYPVGTAVELADGALGIVVATHMSRRDHNTPARPVIALVNDSQGNLLPLPRHLDLNDCAGQSVARTLPAAERHELLNRRWSA